MMTTIMTDIFSSAWQSVTRHRLRSRLAMIVGRACVRPQAGVRHTRREVKIIGGHTAEQHGGYYEAERVAAAHACSRELLALHEGEELLDAARC